MQQWNLLTDGNLSMIGCINVLELNILPEFLDPFQTSPFASSYHCWPCWTHIWQTWLQLPLLQGNCWAVRLSSSLILVWTPVTAAVDQDVRKPQLLKYLHLYSTDLATLKEHTANPFVGETLRAQGAKFSLWKCSPITVFTCLREQKLRSGTDDLGFKFWADRGISKIFVLYETDNESFKEFKQKFSFDSSDKKLPNKDTEL